MRLGFRLSIGLVIGLLLFSACEEVVKDPGLTSEKGLVVSAFISPDSVATVELSQTLGLLDDENDRFINDAEVYFYKNGNIVGYVANGDSGVYQSAYTFDYLDTFKVEVYHPRFAPLFAVNRVPREVSVPKMDTLGIPQSPQQFRLNFRINDNVLVRDYYLVKVKAKVLNWSSGDTVGYSQNIPFFMSNRFDLPGEIENQESNYFWFNDVTFNGDQPLIGIVINRNNLRGFNFRTEEIILYLRRISPDYYNFLSSIRNQDLIFGSPFSSPQNLYSNVPGGYGVVCGFSEKTDTLQLKQ